VHLDEIVAVPLFNICAECVICSIPERLARGVSHLGGKERALVHVPASSSSPSTRSAFE